MKKTNYDKLSIDQLKKQRLNYNLLGLLGLIVALSGLAVFEILDNEKFRFAFYGALFFGGVMSTYRNRAIKINRELKSRADKPGTKKPQQDS